MNFLTSTTITLSLSALLYLVLTIAAGVVTQNYAPEVQQRNKTIISTAGALGALLVARIVFSGDGITSNNNIKLGLYIGAIYLILESVLYRWKFMDDSHKLTILVGAMVILAMLSYTK